jgi:hypothetical protein
MSPNLATKFQRHMNGLAATQEVTATRITRYAVGLFMHSNAANEPRADRLAVGESGDRRERTRFAC